MISATVSEHSLMEAAKNFSAKNTQLQICIKHKHTPNPSVFRQNQTFFTSSNKII